MRALRLLVLFLMSTLGLVAVGVSPAHACTCTDAPRGTDAANGDFAFVGTHVGIDDTVWQFEVERWLSEGSASATGVLSSGDGSCALRLTPGDRVALYARLNEVGFPVADACSIGDPDAALAGTEPPAVHPSAGPARYLIGPGRGPPHYWLVDAAGRVSGFVTEPDLPSGNLHELSLCPGGKRVAELWTDRAIVRDLATLEIIRAVPLPLAANQRNYTGVACRNEAGSEVLVGREFIESPITTIIPDLVDIAAPRTPVITGNFRSLTIVNANSALVTVNPTNTRLEVLNLRNGGTRLLDEARDIEQPVDYPPTIDAYSVSPSGERVVFTIFRSISGSNGRLDTFVWEISPGRQIAAYRQGWRTEPEMQWYGEDELVKTVRSDAGSTRTVVGAVGGEPVVDDVGRRVAAPSTDGPYVVTEEAVVAVDGSRMVALTEDSTLTVAQFPNEDLEGPLAVSPPIQVTADLPVAASPPTTVLGTTTTEQTDSGESVAAPLIADDDAPPDPPTVGWAVAGLSAGVLIVGTTVVVSRRFDDDSLEA